MIINSKIDTTVNQLAIPECPEKQKVRLSYNSYLKHIEVYPCCAYEIYINKPMGIITKEDIVNNKLFETLLKIKKQYNEKHPNNIKLLPLCNNIVQLKQKPYRIDNDILNPIFSCDFTKYNTINSVNVSIQHTCNLNCIMCGYDHKIDKEADELYFLVLEQIKNHNLKFIELTQEGEPFFYKERTLKYLESLTLNDCQIVYIISNITMLNDDDIKRLQKINSTIKIHLTASIDGMTKETYEKIRKNANFEKAMHNILALINCGVLKSINFVVFDINQEEIPLALSFCEKYKIRCNLLPLEQKHEEYRKIINDYRSKFYKNRIQ